MSDLPKRIVIHEEGPREGFQIEPGPIATADKIRFIEALAETGLAEIQCVSFVNPKKVPGWADAEEVAAGIRRRPGVVYDCLWLNVKGLNRAAMSGLDLSGRIISSASEVFSRRNTGMDLEGELAEQRRWMQRYRELGVEVGFLSVMTAFGCNLTGEVPVERILHVLERSFEGAEAEGVRFAGISLADTVGWATPVAIERAIGAVRTRWPDMPIALHLHDTRGAGLANAYAGLRLGVSRFDSACAGLGGCPFAGHKGAAGNICTEDLVFLAEEMGIETGVDLEKLIECAWLAEEIVGHPLPGKVMKGGSLKPLRERMRQAAE